MDDPWTLYIKERDGKPVEYRYGAPWVAEQLFVEGGYSTQEEAKTAWEEYLLGVRD